MKAQRKNKDNKSDIETKTTEKTAVTKKRKKKRSYKNPSHYRLDFINENTFNRVWTVRMTRGKVIVATVTFFASIIALIVVLIAFTPLRYLLPGTMKGDLRAQYLDTALRLDSLERVVRANEIYASNLIAVMNDEITFGTDSAVTGVNNIPTNTSMADSLMQSSEAERRFVQQYEDEERFNLSVLSPIAAEGLVFLNPVGSSNPIVCEGGNAPGPILVSTGHTTAASAIYRGTVIDVNSDSDGSSYIAIQHPNDFISLYYDLGDTFVSKGKKVIAGQRIGHSKTNKPLRFELWHNGTQLNPREYITL